MVIFRRTRLPFWITEHGHDDYNSPNKTREMKHGNEMEHIEHI
jgi:hypothetical protein